MSDFKELSPPAEGRLWYVKVKEDGKVGWLSKHGIITTDTTNVDELYWDTELEAFEAMETYYAHHVRYFPYTAELYVLRQAVVTIPEIDTNESQVMEFE